MLSLSIKEWSLSTKFMSRLTFVSIIVLVIIAVIVNYYYIRLSDTNANASTDGSKTAAKTSHTKPNIQTAKHQPKSSPIFAPKTQYDSRSTALFLEQISDLTLDDFDCLNVDEKETLRLGAISSFNNLQLAPRINAIVQLDYFRYVKLNLQHPCTLWHDNVKCVLRDCSVKLCDESQLPKSLIIDDEMNTNRLSQAIGDECPNDSPQKLSEIDKTISSDHIEAMNSLFECSEDDLEAAQYVDLILNPERYTGYSGESAHRIWRSIYEENCFLQKQSNFFSLDAMCYEERIFYRAISGLHTSINIHLSALYHIMGGTFGHNTNEFIKRFNGQREYIKNLYFLFLLELRALHKAEPYLLNKVNWLSSGDQSLTKEAIKDMLRIVRKFKWHFNESILFKQQPPTVAQEFSQHFHNITSNIMDCVACDKCKLWGKVQTHGLGTAFKILLADNIDKLKLNRHEITCLVNALARLSNSIAQLHVFKKLLAS